MKTKFLLRFWVILLLALTPMVVAQEEGDAGLTIHVVQRGENLYRIAMRYNISVAELTRLNNIVNPASIQVGQRLLVPSSEGQPIETTHIVRAGETLRSIAQRYELTIDELVAWNSLENANNIYIGQTLRLNAPLDAAPVVADGAIEDLGLVSRSADQSAPSSDAARVHTVQRGETLFNIALAYGLTVNELARANSITDPTRIFSGQQLIIPGAGPAPGLTDLPAPISALEITPEIQIPGRTMRLVMRTSDAAAVSGTWLNRPLTAASEHNSTVHYILQGVPMFTEPGIYPLQLAVIDNEGRTIDVTLNIQVASGRYGREVINLLADRGGLLDPALEQQEERIIQSVTGVFNQTRYFDGPMALPAAATIISPYGTNRSYNGGPFDRFHSGTDFAGAPGTPVMATAPGRVVLADALNIRGVATVIDHGWGIYTGYWHQAQQYVRVGDMVTTGQTIGTIGATGRVTGAHLHWEVWAGGVAVDPMQWVRQSFN